jgi:hypothetical protein
VTHCVAAHVGEDEVRAGTPIFLCGAAARAHIQFGTRRFPVCGAHEVLWVAARELRVLSGAAVLRLEPLPAQPTDQDVQGPHGA